MRKLIVILFFLYFIVGCTNNEYIVQFNSNGGSLIENQSIDKGKNAIKPVNPTKEGYIFLYWEYNKKEYNFNSQVKTDLVLNAVWQLNVNVKKYKVTFNNNGSSDNVEVIAGNVVSEPSEPTKEGSTFIGWYLEGEDEPFNFDTIVNYDLILNAKFKDSSDNNGVSNQITYITELSAIVPKTIITKNETIQIIANILPNNASNKNLKYLSSNNRIAKVSDSGLITGLKAGNVTITIQTTDDSGQSDVINLTVIND